MKKPRPPSKGWCDQEGEDHHKTYGLEDRVQTLYRNAVISMGKARLNRKPGMP
jgi:hypothetical protein